MNRAASRFSKIALAAVIAGASVLASVADADARRAGGMGFGSRGTRTFEAPTVTRTAPAPAAPIDRSMTPRPAPTVNQPAFGTQRPGLFGGFGRSMIGGLVAGGLIGLMLGHGFGGGMGFLGFLLQLGLIAVLISFLMRMFAQRRQANPGPAPSSSMMQSPYSRDNGSFGIPSIGGGLGSQQRRFRKAGGDELGLTQRDLDSFERTLSALQAAYASEDYGALRLITTPEAMSYLAEELGENATNGVRNKVSDVKLLQGDISEAWREGGREYATVAMRYSAIDALVDRNTGRLVSGDDRTPQESVEVWTFVRENGGMWKVSAIQGTEQRAA